MWICAWALLAILLLAFAVVVATWLQPETLETDSEMPPHLPADGRR